MSDVVLHLIEEIVVVTECLNHSLDLLLQYRGSACRVYYQHDLLLHDTQGLELKCAHLLDACVPSAHPVYHPAHPQQVLVVDHSHHVRHP